MAAVVMAGPAPAAHADTGGLFGGLADIISGAFALPLDTLAGTLSGPPIIGTVGGLLHGAVQTVALALRGTFKLIGVAIPLAARAAPLIPVFL